MRSWTQWSLGGTQLGMCHSAAAVSLTKAALVLVHPDVKNWIKYARFEEKHSYFAHARKVYERAVEFFGEEHMDEHLYVAFAKFEENQKEVRSSSSCIWVVPRFLLECQNSGPFNVHCSTRSFQHLVVVV